MNKTMPSKKLSYNCEGCLKRLSTLLKLTEKIKSVSLPQSSKIIKFSIQNKKIPIGATRDTKSVYLKKFKLYF